MKTQMLAVTFLFVAACGGGGNGGDDSGTTTGTGSMTGGQLRVKWTRDGDTTNCDNVSFWVVTSDKSGDVRSIDCESEAWDSTVLDTGVGLQSVTVEARNSVGTEATKSVSTNVDGVNIDIVNIAFTEADF